MSSNYINCLSLYLIISYVQIAPVMAQYFPSTFAIVGNAVRILISPIAYDPKTLTS